MSEQWSGAGSTEARCPSCGARVVASQSWCTLCHARLDGGDVTAAPDAQVPSDAQVLGATDPEVPSDPQPVVGSAGPKPVAGPSGPSGSLPPGAAEAMLAELAASTAAGRPLARGPLAGRGRGVRTALALGAAVVLTAVVVALLTLVGLLI